MYEAVCRQMLQSIESMSLQDQADRRGKRNPVTVKDLVQETPLSPPAFKSHLPRDNRAVGGVGNALVRGSCCTTPSTERDSEAHPGEIPFTSSGSSSKNQ